MLGAGPVHVHAEAEVLARLELVELALEQDGVGAEVDESPPVDQRAGDVGDLRMQQRLPSGDADDGGAALVGSAHALRDRELAAEELYGILDFSAASAGEIAAEERFQHQHQRVALSPGEALLQEVSAHRHHLPCRNCHSTSAGGIISSTNDFDDADSVPVPNLLASA